MTKLKWDDEPKGKLSKLTEKLRIPRRSLKEAIVTACFRLQSQRGRLEQTIARLQQRDREIFERCIGAKLSGDKNHAIMYANECAELRKMAKLVMSGQLALERVILRLETVQEFGDVIAQIAPVMSILKETRSRLAGVIPEVAMELDQVNSLLSNTLLETGEVEATQNALEATSAEAKKVLEEASAIAEQKIKERFPEIPPLPMPEGPLPEGAPPGSPSLGTHIGANSLPLEDQVYDYIVKHDGRISPVKCASELKVSEGDVKKALQALKEKGRIVIP
jgi:division protein CdvB (Snf7/Vps24/ESCRT-III family)